jgi:DASS family divalent anion:Na+ symporter
MWALAGLLPGVVSLSLIPLVLYKIYPPEVRETPEAAGLARRELEEMGPVSKPEKILFLVFIGVLGFWATSQIHQLSATSIALAGVVVLLLFDVLSWKNILEETGAWDALIWFGGLVMMAGQLNEMGLIGWFTGTISGFVQGWPWILALIVLLLIYFYSHYGFASMTAHVTAMYPAFLVAAVAAGAPAYLTALALAFFSNLNASMTHYGAGPAPIYFGSGYVELTDWWKLGLVISLLNVFVWICIGFPYWKLLGLW